MGGFFAGAGLAAAGASGPAAPVTVAVEGIITGVSALIRAFHIGGGCGQPCTDASQIEQIYEAAADFIAASGKGVYLTQAECVAVMQELIQGGQANEAALGTQQARNGAANLTKVITAEIAYVQRVTSANQTPKAWDRNANLDLWNATVPQSRGWYQTAYMKGQALAVQIIEQGVVPARGTVTNALSSLTGGGSGSSLLLLAGGALLAVKKGIFKI
ncbi:MAG: hypothetical protein KGJ13_06120 [Patescibacteria group bacterium]|nr:hypothetical protein [Patescibacteria group bacterium]